MASRDGRRLRQFPRGAWAIGLAVLLLVPGLPGLAGTTVGSPQAPVRSIDPTHTPVPSRYSPVSLPSLTGTWENLTPNLTSYPPPRAAAAMADDPLLHAVVLFGGNDPYTGNADGDTWEFVNGSWTDLTSTLSTAPSARWGAGLAWDPEYQGLILFGGRDNAYTNWIYNDTWLFNSTGWHLLNVTGDVAPSPRTPYAGLIYDATDDYLLLFGGNYDNSYRLNDTWSFQNNTWTDLSANLTLAPPQAGFSAANDSPDGYDLFFGGATWSGGNYDETWSYANGHWTNRTATSGPQPPMTAGSDAITYDPVDRGVVLFSGEDDNYGVLNCTYLYAGGNWTNISASVGLPPLARWEGKMAYDASLGGDLMVGGNEGNGLYYNIYAQNDTWELAHPFQVAALANATKGIVPMTVNFSSVAGPGTGATAYNWSFGDGTPNATTENATHIFGSTGVFLVTLAADDSAGHVATTTLSIHVYPPLSVTTTIVGSSIDVALAVDFRSSAYGGVPPLHEHWSFGDGAGSSVANTTHTYSTAGTFPWTLVVTDSENHMRAVSGNVTVYPTLVVSSSATVDGGVVPLNVTFTASVTAGDPPYAINWSFGDGASAGNLSNVSHTYVTAGVYPATLTVTDGGGGVFQTTIVVHAVEPLALVSSVSPLSGPAPLNLQYSVSPTGGEAPYSVTWTFAPSLGASTYTVGSFTFATAGSYWVNVSVVDAFGDRDSRSFPVVVTEPLAAALTASGKQGLAPFNVTLDAVTTGGEAPLSYIWTFGDGQGVTGAARVSHEYATAGTFLAQVVTESTDGQHATSSYSIRVAAPPELTVAANLTIVPLGGSVAFTAQTTGGFPAWNFAWSGLPAGCTPANTSTIDCTPATAGVFRVDLTATDTIGDVRTGAVNVTVVAPPPTPVTSGLSPLDLEVIGGAVVAAVVAGVAIVVARRRGPPAAPGEAGSTDFDPPAGDPPPGGW